MEFSGVNKHLEVLHEAMEKNDILIWNEFNEKLLQDNQRGDLSGVKLEGVYLKYINLKGVNLGGADLSGADLEGADLKWINLKSANLSGCFLARSDLRWANLEQADLKGADLTESDLKRANLEKVNLRDASLKSANLIGANLEGVMLEGANLKETDFRGAHINEQTLRSIKIKQLSNYDKMLEIKLAGNWFVADFMNLLNVIERIYDFFIIVMELKEISGNIGKYSRHGNNILSAISENIINNRWRIQDEDRLEIDSIETISAREIKLTGKAIHFLKDFIRELDNSYQKIKDTKDLQKQQEILMNLIEDLDYFNKQKNILIDIGIAGDDLVPIISYLRKLKLKLLDYMERGLIEFISHDK